MISLDDTDTSLNGTELQLNGLAIETEDNGDKGQRNAE